MKRKLLLILFALPLLSGLGGCIVYDGGFDHRGHYWRDGDRYDHDWRDRR
jgi:hypothetical protein